MGFLFLFLFHLSKLGGIAHVVMTVAMYEVLWFVNLVSILSLKSCSMDYLESFLNAD